ncbi:unnamed protein product [Enterobius vermicularis]|uniref:Sulfatase domain-containing protein n=1 Tax=Enterobius vermicularis TaxID=51028 RepID=A0A0N4VAM5_ENTVE|nr:unnamed protein product [Enterobius vermicularis]
MSLTQDTRLEFYRSLQCDSTMPNLASLDDDGYLVVQSDLNPTRRSKLPCYYQSITGSLYPKISSYESSERIALEPHQFVKVKDDQFIVECFNKTTVARINSKEYTNNSLLYSKAFATFSDKFPKVKIISANSVTDKLRDFDYATPESPSLSILVFDSLARNQFLRHMRRSLEYMKKLGFIFFEGYTKVGDNSNVNLLPILAGKSTLPKVGGNGEELMPENKTIDFQNLETLWTIMKVLDSTKYILERRCITMFNDEIGHKARGLFHYGKPQYHGFKVPPTNYYFRPFHIHLTQQLRASICTPTGQFSTELFLNLWENFAKKFKDYCNFSFNFITLLSHDHASYIELADEKLRISLERLYASGAFNNTAFVIMGDHGNRISNIQRSYVGRIEERAPLLSIKLPESFSAKYAEKVKILKKNTKRLISNYDVHQTLKDIAKGKFRSERPFWQQKGRGKSMFEEVVETDRTCEDAGIPYNFCLCMEKQGNSRLSR